MSNHALTARFASRQIGDDKREALAAILAETGADPADDTARNGGAGAGAEAEGGCAGGGGDGDGGGGGGGGGLPQTVNEVSHNPWASFPIGSFVKKEVKAGPSFTFEQVCWVIVGGEVAMTCKHAHKQSRKHTRVH